jgi:hypothetical protein
MKTNGNALHYEYLLFSNIGGNVIAGSSTFSNMAAMNQQPQNKSSQAIAPKKFFRQRDIMEQLEKEGDVQPEGEEPAVLVPNVETVQKNEPPTTGNVTGPAAKRAKKQPKKKKNKKEETIARNVIQQVQNFPILYDTTRDDYKDTGRKMQLWRQIASREEIASTADDVHRIWQNVRRNRAKHERLKRKVEKSGGKGAFKCHWAHWETTHFLTDHIRQNEK